MQAGGTGLVLGAGGVLGAAWTIGALAALRQERGLDPRDATVLVGNELRKVAATGTRVTVLGPTAEDLAVIGANLMDPTRRTRVLETSLRTSAAALRARRLASTA